jgi:hypothetical protein
MLYPNTKNIFVAIDGEWTEKEFVSLQFIYYLNGKAISKNIIFNSELLESKKKGEIEKECAKQGINAYFEKYDDDRSFLHEHTESMISNNFSPEMIKKKNFIVNVLFFYSFKDLQYGFGFNNLRPFFTDKPKYGNNPWILQSRAIMGKLLLSSEKLDKTIVYRFRDLKGYTNSSLVELANSLGVEMLSKESLRLDRYYEGRLDRRD